MVSVNPVGGDGKVGEPQQVIPTARNAHAIITDRNNRFAFVPHLGNDQVFVFTFDAKTGRLSANTPPVLQLKAGTGPRHLITSPDNKFVYLLNELTATVSTLTLDQNGRAEGDRLDFRAAEGQQASARHAAAAAGPRRAT